MGGGESKDVDLTDVPSEMLSKAKSVLDEMIDIVNVHIWWPLLISSLAFTVIMALTIVVYVVTAGNGETHRDYLWFLSPYLLVAVFGFIVLAMTPRIKKIELSDDAPEEKAAEVKAIISFAGRAEVVGILAIVYACLLIVSFLLAALVVGLRGGELSLYSTCSAEGASVRHEPAAPHLKSAPGSQQPVCGLFDSVCITTEGGHAACTTAGQCVAGACLADPLRACVRDANCFCACATAPTIKCGSGQSRVAGLNEPRSEIAPRYIVPPGMFLCNVRTGGADVTLFVFGSMLLLGSIFLVVWIISGAVRARKIAEDYGPAALAKRAVVGGLKSLGVSWLNRLLEKSKSKMIERATFRFF